MCRVTLEPLICGSCPALNRKRNLQTRDGSALSCETSLLLHIERLRPGGTEFIERLIGQLAKHVLRVA